MTILQKKKYFLIQFDGIRKYFIFSQHGLPSRRHRLWLLLLLLNRYQLFPPVLVRLIDVHIEVASLGERLSADIALVGPLTGVGVDVQFEIEALRKPLATVGTVVLFRRCGTLRVRPLDMFAFEMCHHLVHRGERSIALVALERTLRIVRGLHVVVEIAFLCERSMAELTRVRFVSGVSIDVSLQVSRLVEMLFTVRTLPLLFVFDVHHHGFEIMFDRGEDPL